jgi:hypothetical protein
MDSAQRSPASAEKEALRIQAAAVAAQQAALADAERRLARRATTLNQQESQLAAHLDDKHRRLLAIRDQVREERALLLAERARYEKDVRQNSADLEQSRFEVASAAEQNQIERRRLLSLRTRLRQRLHRHWMVEREVMRRREAALAARGQEMERHGEAIELARAALLRLRLHVHSECAIARKQLEADKTDFDREKERWRDWMTQQEQEQRRRAAALDEVETTQARRQRELAVEEDRMRDRRSRLEHEADGLENRVHNLRQKLREQAAPSPVSISSAEILPPRPVEAAVLVGEARRDALNISRLAAELADQRSHLRDVAERLFQAREVWRHEQEALIGEFQTLAQRLRQRERDCEEREHGLQAASERCQQRQQQIEELQQHLDAFQARLTVRVAAWEGERERHLADVRMREQLVARQAAAMELLSQRWHERRAAELQRLRAQAIACGKLRQAAAAARELWLQRQQLVFEQQRSERIEHTAAQQLQEELGLRPVDPRAIVERLDRLRDQLGSLDEGQLSALEEARRTFAGEAGAVESAFTQWQRYVSEVAQQEALIGKREAAWEKAKLLAQADSLKLRQEAYRLRLERDANERRLAEVSQEVERLASALLAADDRPSPSAKAA